MATARRLNDSRLDFLDKAAEALTVTSPLISAHLGSVRNGLLNGVHGSAINKEYCGSCGAKMIPGWLSIVEKETKSKRTRKDRLAEEASGIKTRSIKCLNCSTVISRSTTKHIGSQQATKKLSATRTAGTVATDRIEKASAPGKALVKDTRNNPKRRTRAKKSSLQALLMSKVSGSSTQASVSGLSLQDFLK